jgi:hypothetical protein
MPKRWQGVGVLWQRGTADQPIRDQMTLPGQLHLILGTGSTSHVITSQFSKLYFVDTLYRPLENLDAIALRRDHIRYQ